MFLPTAFQVIHKIQECEALLAAAQDKGEQIAAEGSVTDRNTIAEQLTSLKQQLSTLKRAVEKRRGEHENAAAEYKRLTAQFDRLGGPRKELVQISEAVGMFREGAFPILDLH